MKVFLWAVAVIFLLCDYCLAQQIIGFTVFDITHNSVRIKWQTIDSATSFAKVYLNSVEMNSTGSCELTTKHEVFVPNLLANTTYAVEAWSEIKDGPWITSTRKNFTTLDGEVKLTLSLNEEILPDAIIIHPGQTDIPLIKFKVSVNNVEAVFLRLTFHLSVPVDTLVYNFVLKDDQGTVWATQMYSRKMTFDFMLTSSIQPGQSINYIVYGDVQTMKKYGIFRLTCEPPADINASVMSGQTVTVRGKLSGNRFSIEPTTGVGGDFMPSAITLEQNYPNPCREATTIKFSLASPQIVTLTIYDILGREAAVALYNVAIGTGMHEVIINSSALSPGVYVYRLRSAAFVIQKQMIFLK